MNGAATRHTTSGAPGSGGLSSAVVLAAGSVAVLLEARDVTVRFGGLVAVDSVSASFRAGEVLVVAVTLASGNRDQGARETLNVDLKLANGDQETIALIESARDSGEFLGIINTIAVPPSIVSGDCRLSVTPGAPVVMTVTDVDDARLVAIANIDFLVDPFGIVFDSGDDFFRQ